MEVEPARRAARWQYLSAQPEFACGLGVGSHQEFLAGSKQLATKPRLVLADLQLPGCSGLTGLRQRLPAGALFSLSGYRQAECVAAAGLVIGPRVARLLTCHFHPAPPPAPQTDLTGCSFSCYPPGEAPCPALGPRPLG